MVEVANPITHLLQAVDRADSADALLDAVEALAEARSNAAIPTLIEVLGYNNPGAAVAAVDGLIALGSVAVPAILEQLDGYNYGARAWATRALAGIGDLRALELLLSAAMGDFSLSVRRAAARGLGNLQWQQLPVEKRPAGQTKVLETLVQVTEDAEWVVRYAAIAGLQSLLSALDNSPPLNRSSAIARLQQLALSDPVLVVRARSQLALQRLPESDCDC